MALLFIHPFDLMIHFIHPSNKHAAHPLFIPPPGLCPRAPNKPRQTRETGPLSKRPCTGRTVFVCMCIAEQTEAPLCLNRPSFLENKKKDKKKRFPNIAAFLFPVLFFLFISVPVFSVRGFLSKHTNDGYIYNIFEKKKKNLCLSISFIHVCMYICSIHVLYIYIHTYIYTYSTRKNPCATPSAPVAADTPS